MLETLAVSALMLAVATQQEASEASPFAPEVCASSTAQACETARAFVERAKGRKCLVAFKAARLLYLFEDGKPVDREVDLKDYDPLMRTSVNSRVRFPVPMALSRRAVGHKLRLADARTPEGEYEICGSVAASEYTYFLSVSYPSQKDVDAAVKEKRFDEKALERIKKSQRAGACPDFYSALGGTIGSTAGRRRWPRTSPGWRRRIRRRGSSRTATGPWGAWAWRTGTSASWRRRCRCGRRS
jgi:hypothetical protein